MMSGSEMPKTRWQQNIRRDTVRMGNEEAQGRRGEERRRRKRRRRRRRKRRRKKRRKKRRKAARSNLELVLDLVDQGVVDANQIVSVVLVLENA